MKHRGFGLVCAVAAVWLLTAPALLAELTDGQWCQTQQKWETKAQAQQQAGGFQGGTCNTQGVCDDPSVRDSFIPDENTPFLTLRMRIVVFAEDGGGNPASTQEEVDQQIQALNADLAQARISFVATTEFVNSTEFRYFDGGEEFSMKQAHAVDPESQLNVFVTGTTGYSVGTFPWDSDSLTFLGGIIMGINHWQPDGSVFAHEVGHCIGLWHTHHGVSEVAQCSGCYESPMDPDADFNGDFCSDTAPTPTNYNCGDPGGNDPCSGTPWAPTDFDNIMGYAPDHCITELSLQQRGRAQCWFNNELTGWLIDQGSGALNFTYPEPLPEFAGPATSTALEVQIAGFGGVFPEQNTGQLFYSVDGGPFVQQTMSFLGGTLYKGTLPAAPPCGGNIRYYFAGDSTEAETFTDPPNAPAETYELVSAFGSRILSQNGFEGDASAWTVVSDPSLSSGGWEQVIPVGTFDGGEAVAPDRDAGSSAEELQAFVTENGQTGGAADATDVDGGPTDLISPPVDLAGDDGRITYSRWFYSDGSDTLTVSVSGDGSSWTTVETVSGIENTWTESSFIVSDYITPTSQVQVRFRVSDDPDDSITEAGVDSYTAERLLCSSCNNNSECQDVVFCNGAEECDQGYCVPAAAPPCGAFCLEDLDTCVDCIVDLHCDDGLYCNGPETCQSDVCVPGSDPCNGGLCNDFLDSCVDCLFDGDCQDGVFCNGVETCNAGGGCDPNELGACPGRTCDEPLDQCLGTAELQPRAGEPLLRLTEAELTRFEAGKQAFQTVFEAADGLGPIYNANSCAACHAGPDYGGWSSTSVTLFGNDNGVSFDPLTSEGGLMLQSQTTDAQCVETVPPSANVSIARMSGAGFGAGLVQAVEDADLQAIAAGQSEPITGHAAMIVDGESGETRVGRFGWKSQQATLISATADCAANQIGLTNRVYGQDNAPNGNAALLAQCDTVADPEDGPGAFGTEFVDRVADFHRYLAPPPQTPRRSMNGENFFTLSGCGDCHRKGLRTPNDPTLGDALRDQILNPFSDFLVHDMGDQSDGVVQGDASGNEMRTAPLWGLRQRDALWHDGSITGATFNERVVAAITAHQAPGSEAANSAASYFGWPASLRNQILDFLGSLGRAEFDHDADNDIDADDYADFQACYTGDGKGANLVTPDDPCAIHDADGDRDIDDDDLAGFFTAAGGGGGRVPDGASAPGTPLTIERAGPGQMELFWSDSCLAWDDDYEVYEGDFGDWSSHVPVTCSTSGATNLVLDASGPSKYYLVVPRTPFHEGSYGVDSSGAPRPVGDSACLMQFVGDCP
ncbi:MAG: hypothetical protein GY716_19910 [bacterium]|nr:hypothetical protein [bacterium]